MRKFYLFFLCILPLFAESEIILESLRGIVFLGSWHDVRKQPVYDIDGIEVKEVPLLENHPKFLEKIHDEYIGKELSRKTISYLKKELASFYSSKNHPFVFITIPKQELTKCMLQVVVEESKVGQITSIGNCYFSTQSLSDEITLEPGDPIDTKTLYEDIAWLNLNPFRRTDAIYSPGEKFGTTDIELVTIDRFPYRVYAGAENTGTYETNRNRLFFGFDFGKSIFKDGQVSYQFTSSPNWNLFYSHTASARLPLPWRHIVVLWGGYTEVKPDTSIPSIKNHGINWEVSGRYRIPIFMSLDVMQTVTFGYDFKETNNTILQDSIKVFKTNADINQFSVGYELGFENKRWMVTFLAELYGGPGRMTYADRDEFYRLLRYKAKNTYAYLKLNHSLAKKISLGALSYNLFGQASSANLLPSEQVSLTGYNGVRGFDENFLNRDNALVFNLTYETPRVSILSFLGKKRFWDEFYVIGFFDCAAGFNHERAPDEKKFARLASAGPGVRYQMDQVLSFRFDYGFQLYKKGFFNPSSSRYNFGLALSY